MLYVLIVCALIAADQALKYWTVSHLAVGQSAPLLPGIMRLTRLHNYGAAWSSLSGKTALLIAVTAALLVGVFVLLVRRIVRQHHRPDRPRLCGGYVRPGAVHLPHLQPGGLLRGGGGHPGRRLLPVPLRQDRREGEIP